MANKYLFLAFTFKGRIKSLIHTEMYSVVGENIYYAKEGVSPTGVYLCAASLEQAKRAVGYIGDKCELIETSTSDHVIHTAHSKEYIDAVNSLRIINNNET